MLLCDLQRVLLQDLPVIPSRQPQRLTDFERRQIMLSGQEAMHDYAARAKVKDTVGIVDMRIVCGESEDKAMTTAQSRVAAEDVFDKVAVDMRQRKREYRDSNVVHMWTRTSSTGTLL